jgi:hypothetical protein
MEEINNERLKYLTEIIRASSKFIGDISWEGFLFYKIKNVYNSFRSGYLSKYPDDKYFLVDDELMFHAFLLARNRILENKEKYLTNNVMRLNDSKVDKLIIETFLFPSLILNGVNKRVEVYAKYSSKYIKEIEAELKTNRNEMQVYVEKFKDIKKIKTKQTKIETVKLSIRQQVNPKMREKITRKAEDCRFKNGRINYTKLGTKLGVDNKTAKNWCAKYGITHQLPS